MWLLIFQHAQDGRFCGNVVMWASEKKGGNFGDGEINIYFCELN